MCVCVCVCVHVCTHVCACVCMRVCEHTVEYTGKLRLSGARFCVLPSLLNTAMLSHQLKAKINDIVHIKYTIIWFHMVDKVTKIISKDALSQY